MGNVGTIFILFLTLNGFYLISSKCLSHEEELVYQWVSVEFLWPNDTFKQEYIDTGKYIPENNAINGIKVYNDSVFLTIPRLKVGVAASLVMIDKISPSESPVVSAYPSWEMHIQGDCNTLQLVQSMEIDPENGLMWILHTAYVPSSPIEVAKRCLPKIVVWDINENVEVYRYVFKKEVITDPFYLNDLVLDYGTQKEVQYVYMSDTLGRRMVVYNHIEKKDYVFFHASFERNMMYSNITINGVSEMVPLSINGIAISDDFTYVYYCPMASQTLYRVPTSALRNSTTDMNTAVQTLGSKDIQSDGLYFGKGSSLFYSTLGQNGVYRWDTITNTKEAVVTNATIEWVDSLGMDAMGYLWFTSNNLHKYFKNGTTPGKSNYYVWKVYVGEKGYLDVPKGGPRHACSDTDSSGTHPAEINKKWVSIDFEWQSCKQLESAVESNTFIAKNNEVHGIRSYNDKIYLTIPREKTGVMATVGVLDKQIVRPFPWSAMNKIGDCNALQSVQSVEVDINTGYIWMLDTGKSCDPKLVVYNLKKNAEVFRYEFTANELGQKHYLEDIVLDYIDYRAAFAYISDSAGQKLIIFDIAKRIARYVTHSSMNYETQHENITIAGTQTGPHHKGIKGIALSPNFRYLYYSPLASTKLYQIDTYVLRNKSSTDADIDNSVTEVGSKDFPTSGMYSSQRGLYMTDLTKGSIVKWSYSASGSFENGQVSSKTEVTKNCLVQWLESPYVDENGNLWFTSRNIEPFFGNSTMAKNFNFYLWKSNIGESSYLSGQKREASFGIKPAGGAMPLLVPILWLAMKYIFIF